MTTADGTVQQGQALTSKERWFFGGLGGLAPMLVAAATQDLEALFARVTMFATLGFGVKTAALAFLGGLVSYLQKTETEAWKCFIIGISAPALVTTAVGTARAQSATLALLARQVPIVTIGSFAETRWEQFSRGLVGYNPNTTFIVLGQANKASDAQVVSAAGWLDFTCDPKEDQSENFSPVVLQRKDGTFVSGIVTRADSYSLRTTTRKIPIEDVITFSRAKAQMVLSKALTEPYMDVNPQDAQDVYRQINPKCREQARVIPVR